MEIDTAGRFAGAEKLRRWCVYFHFAAVSEKRIPGEEGQNRGNHGPALGEASHEIHNIDEYDYRVINEDLDTAISRSRRSLPQSSAR